MSEEREALIEAARKAINELFSDRYVSQAETKKDLQELQGYIDVMIDTLD